MGKGNGLTLKKSLICVVVGAILTGLFALAVNLYVTVTSLRTTLVEQNRLQLQRSLNFLLIVKDELTSTQNNIDQGHLRMTLSGSNVVLPRSEWPTQMWTATRWNDDILNVDSSLLKVLASIYDDVYHANTLVGSARDMLSAGNYSSRILASMAIMASEDPKVQYSIADKLNEPTSELSALIAVYDDATQRVRQRLPDVLTALDMKIAELQMRVGR